jgi:uncharacterized protein YqiB (DUF1249 family)
MLRECQLVPEAVIKPGSFVGLMALYESNYLRLLRLIPELCRLDGYYRSAVAGDTDLHIEIVERSRYTITLTLSYFFEENGQRVADPDMKVRVYLDGLMAEAMHFSGEHRHPEFRRLSRSLGFELDRRWRRNVILNKWLEYLMDQGHLVLER